MEVRLISVKKYARSSIKNALKKADKYYILNFDAFHNWEIGELKGKELRDFIESYLCKGKHKVLNEYTGRQIEILKKAVEVYIKKKKKISDSNDDKLNKILKDCKKNILHKDWLSIRDNYQQLKNDEYIEKFITSSYDENEKIEGANESGKTNTISTIFTKSTDIYNNEDVFSDTDVLYSNLAKMLDAKNTSAEWKIEISEYNSDDFEYIVIINNLAEPSENLELYLQFVKRIIRSVSYTCNIQSLEKNGVNYLIGYFNLD